MRNAYDIGDSTPITEVLTVSKIIDEGNKFGVEVTNEVAYHNFWVAMWALKRTDGICPICNNPFSKHHQYLPDFECILNKCMFHTDFEGGG